MFPQIFGKYVLERELASGGMARVFLATLRGAGGFEKRLVVKQIRPELASDQSFIQRFVAEAKTTVELSHANIVPVYELGAEQGTYYIAMEFCAGVSLAELLRAGPVSPNEGAYIGVEICRALDYAHRKAGVVHRDVTPRNVMIDPEGMVRLIDFGIASPVSATGGGLAFGSPGHMPPEQLRAGPLTPAADVFAVAALLVEAWSGQPPFRRHSFQASLAALSQPPPLLAATEACLGPLDPLIESALAHGASERPQTAEELARPLREFLRPHDLGDIARRLGARVSERWREHGQGASSGPGSVVRSGRSASAASVASSAVSSAASSASTSTGPSSAPPPMDAASTGASASGTATFAARDVLREWTAKIESGAPARGSASPQPSSEIESGITASSASASASSDLGRGRRLRRFGSGVALVVGGALALGLMAQRWFFAPASAEPAAATAAPRPGSPVSPAPDQASIPAATAPLPPARAALPQPLSLPLPPDAAHAPERDPKLPASVRASPRAASNAPAPLARLQLTAEPAAWVEIDSSRVGRTPLLNHGSTPGHHTITFVNQLLGERLEADVTLDPKLLTRVHADFTSANPRVYVR